MSHVLMHFQIASNSALPLSIVGVGAGIFLGRQRMPFFWEN